MMSPSPSPKRKSVDEVNDDFSLSSPATKIRRLDAGLLPPIMEEDEELHTTTFHQSTFNPPGVENEERAIVLFNPAANNTLHSPPPTFSVTSHILSGLKSQLDLWSRHSNLLKSSAEEEDVDDKTSDEDYVSNQCLAVVPWVQYQLPQTAPLVQQVDASETTMMMMMEEEADQNEQVASMDIEQEQDNNNFADNSGIDQMRARESFQQWQQQHCMVPPQLIPRNAAPATPNVWFR